MDGEAEHAEHAVGAVDEGQALLFVELDGRQARVGERNRGVDLVASVDAYATLAHEGERAVAERREVTGAAERAVLVDDRSDPLLQQGEVETQRLLADAGAAGREGLHAQQHERSHDLLLDLGARAGGVAAHEGALQLGTLLVGDVGRGERAEPGRDAVVGDRVLREALDDGAGGPHPLPGAVADLDAGVVAGDGDDLVDGEGPVAEDDGGGVGAHKSHATPLSPGSWVPRTR